PGLRLTELVYSANFKTPNHVHQTHRIHIRLQGSSIQTYENKSVTRLPSSAEFYCPGDIHANHYLPPVARNLSIEFLPGEDFSILRSWLENRKCSFGIDDPSLRCLCVRLYSEFRHPDELSTLAVEGLVMELVASLWRGNVGNSVGKPPRWLRQAEELIRGRYAEHLSLADISGAVGIHPIYLARQFRRFHKQSIGEYVRHLRIQFAMEQISKTNRSLSDLALAAGFSDQSHFSTTFRKLTGLTPRQFKEMSR
ncbi:MAG: helix-turn-helix transcriptional regulator, partial [Terriglobia bacterium]